VRNPAASLGGDWDDLQKAKMRIQKSQSERDELVRKWVPSGVPHSRRTSSLLAAPIFSVFVSMI